MSMDKEAFKAEVYRRGREKVAARKRARKRALISCASVTACLALFVALSPSFGWWDSLESGKNMAADQIMPGAPLDEPSGGRQDEEMNAALPDPHETYAESGTMPPYEALPEPDNDAPEDEATSHVTSLCSVEVTAQSDERIHILHTDPDRLVEIGNLFLLLGESDHGLSDGDAGESETGYSITVTYRFDETDEYIWSGEYWTVVDEGRTVALTADEVEALTELLLQSEAD